MQPLGKAVRELLVMLVEHDVRCLVVVGFAVAVHGTPRYTCSLDNAGRLIRALDAEGLDE